VLALAARTLALPTAPFLEGAVIAWLMEFAAARPQLSARVDAHGNVEIRRRGVRPSAAPLVLAAHMDHPGLHAVSCRRAGRRFRVTARFLGGVPAAAMRGAGVRFLSRGLECRARVVSARRSGRTGDAHLVLHANESVEAGALGVWDLPGFARHRRQPDLLEGRACDDLAGVAAALGLLDAIERIDPARGVDVRGLFTRAEEVGFVGALACVRSGRLPAGSCVISLEASRALPHAPQGAGPIVRVGDRSSIFDDGLTRWLVTVAEGLAARRGGFRWQRRLMDGGTCEATAYQQLGMRSAALCVALGNYHNVTARGGIGVESIRLSDLVGLVRLLEALVRHDGDRPVAGGAGTLAPALLRRAARRRRELARGPWA
jgi:endoglucanase